MKFTLSTCVVLVFINRIYVNITTPERFCTICEKCKFLSMGYISAMTQVSVLNEARMFVCDLKLYDDNLLNAIPRQGPGPGPPVQNMINIRPRPGAPRSQRVNYGLLTQIHIAYYE